MVLMHNADVAEYPRGVFAEVVAWLTAAIEAAQAAGVRRERLIVDPGIGFGKTPEHSIELLHRLNELKLALGELPMLVGTSRKRFIGELLVARRRTSAWRARPRPSAWPSPVAPTSCASTTLRP